MNLTREKKTQILEKLKERIAQSKSFVIAQYLGTKVNDIEKIRQSAFDNKLDFQVAKNTLLKKALTESKIDLPEEIFDQAITVMWGYDDEIAPSKTLMSFAKEIDSIKPIGVVLDGKYYDASQVKILAEMPGKQELLAKLVGTLNAPIANFVYVMSANVSGLVNVLNQIKIQKEKV